MELSSIDLTDYLENKSNHRGNCRDCGMQVFWSKINLINHKRKACIITEEQKALWEFELDPVTNPITRNLNDYLENKNPLTRRGTCKTCGSQVFWSMFHLANHKRSKCSISNEEINEWVLPNADTKRSNQRKSNINIGSYLENKDMNRRGNCITCGIDVHWSIKGLVNHKQKKCIESEKTNKIWVDYGKNVPENVEAQQASEPLETYETEIVETGAVELPGKSGEIRVTATDIIAEYLQDKNISTRRGTCKVCFANVYWTISHLSYHKLRRCPIPESEQESWLNLKDKLAQAKIAKSQEQDTEVNIGDYLTDKNILTRRGTCRVCQKRVYWATMHLASHKKSKCPISEDEKAFWTKLRKENRVNIYVVKETDVTNEANQSMEEEMVEQRIIEEPASTNNINETAPTVQKSYNNNFKCSYCDKIFKSRTCLIIHEKVHTNPFICDYCQKAFCNKHYLKLHIFTHIKNRSAMSNKDLEQEFNVKRLLEMFDVQDEDSDKNIVFEQVLIKHDATKRDDDYDMEAEPEVTEELNNHFECCGHYFESFRDLAWHQYSDHTESFQNVLDSMRDEVLELMAMKNSPKSDHEVSETIEIDPPDYAEEETLDESGTDELPEDFIILNVNVECFICETELPALSYDKHLSTVHPLEDAARAKQATAKFCCNCCTETFQTITLCISHLKTACHQFIGTRCNICSARGFQNLKDLNEHRRQKHVKNKIFFCETCQMTFKTAKNLKLHLMKHKQPVVCTICGHKTLTPEKMTQHMAKHVKEPEIVCPYCVRTYKGSFKLRKHIYDCHNQRKESLEERLRPIPCKQCSTVCLGKERLQAHMNKCHRRA